MSTRASAEPIRPREAITDAFQRLDPEDGDADLRRQAFAGAIAIGSASSILTPTLLAITGEISPSFVLGAAAGMALLVAVARTAGRSAGLATTLILLVALLGSFFSQWNFGGGAASGWHAIWAITAPIGAVLFVGPRAALGWMLALLVALPLDAWIEHHSLVVPAHRPAWLPPVLLAINVGGVAGIVCVTVHYLSAQRRRIGAALAREHERSEALLAATLPAAVIARLKSERGAFAESFADATILFADLAGFTPLSATMAPAALVALLDSLFSEFDDLAARHGLEKIKTIGDAYMVAAGVPTPRSDHAAAIADFALDLVEVMARRRAAGETSLELRIGIHRGPVVAGVIGHQKLVYDLWGDAVNTASRMESHGAPGRVHVSDAARRALEATHLLAARGEVEIKGKGPMPTFWLEGRRTPR